MIITIDGGSASGKTTIATALSERYEIPLLESGSLYRTLTYFALENGVTIENEKEVLCFIDSLKLEMKLAGRRWKLLVNGEAADKKKLRGWDVAEKVGLFAKIAGVRKRLVNLQRSCVSKENPYLVAEGRDLGTVIFSRANFKFYLQVSEANRSQRRKSDFEKLGVEVSESSVDKLEAQRDKIDRERKVSPLKIPKGAIIIDTTGKTPAQSTLKVIQKINIRKKRANILYATVCWCRFIIHPLFQVTVEGKENIPDRGGFILASNHLSHLDPIMLGVYCGRAMAFVARSTLFQINRFFSWLLRVVYTISLNRDNPERKTMKQILHTFLKGFGVVFFPEGTRSRDGKLSDFKKGIGLLGLRTMLPVIPAAIRGTEKAMTPGRSGVRKAAIHIKFGPPVDLSDLYEKNLSAEAAEEATQRVREAILKLQNN